MESYKFGDLVEIRRTSDNSLICSGRVVDDKQRIKSVNIPALVSLDYKHFFNSGSSKIVILKRDKLDLVVDYKEIKDLVLKPWRECKTHMDVFGVDIVRDFDLSELDPEVMNLVHALNRIPNLRTVGSCSGHDVDPPYVDCTFKTIESMVFLLGIIDSDLTRDYFVLRSYRSIVNDNSAQVTLKLIATQSGKEGYKRFNILAELIEASL